MQAGPDPSSNRVGSDVNARFDRGLVSRLLPPATARCITDDGAFRNSDDDPVPPGAGVVRKPFLPLFERHRFDVEREVRLHDVAVVYVVEPAEVFFAGGSYRDFAVAQSNSQLLRFTTTKSIQAARRRSRQPELPCGSNSARRYVVQRAPRGSPRRTRAGPGVQGGHRGRSRSVAS